MATLQIEFNCLCLFVPDEETDTVHVLMPATKNHADDAEVNGAAGDGHEHGHDGAKPAANADDEVPAGAKKHAPPHAVRLQHPSFANEDQGLLPIEGWALELGPAGGKADLAKLQAEKQIADLTALTAENGAPGKMVDRALLNQPGGAVLSRVTLRGGRLHSVDSKAVFSLGGQLTQLAHKVVWEMEGVARLEWRRLGGDGVSVQPIDQLGPPTQTLNPESDKRQGYLLKVWHVTEDSLPPNELAKVPPEELQHHFRAFYDRQYAARLS